MKKIRELNDSTPGLSEYVNLAGSKANWEKFRSHNSGMSQRELRDSLIQNQHGLCAYCEIKLTETDRQIEHVIPRSDPQHGAAREVDITNMIACCVGGTRSKTRKRGGPSCGQAKGNKNDENFIDPRLLPAQPSLTKILHDGRNDGRITVDEEACKSENIPAARVRKTIEILNLNAEWLQLERTKYRKELVERSKQYDNPDTMNAWIRTLLTPDENGQLTPFFTTTRSYFTPLSESILAEQPQTWI